ncbi:hypothetical protein K431DRAFT_63789 [Polychaeton citri CBS 116435]|uniref:Uncharacterized protein n=1 Tax=Polychaeton citri CBS 116435 TaxID=1314669 RepID=A0A9P4Q707_9PEZI|nr:hypothetical protein K431DRAFT_63789 [Polychaeton citri CBS 116435]
MALSATQTGASSLPWFRDATESPGPLPTRAGIESATKTLPNNHNETLRRIILVNWVSVVKYGLYVFENEGRALLLAGDLAQVPAPRLFAMYLEEEKLYVIMELIKDLQLSEPPIHAFTRILWGRLERLFPITIFSHHRRILLSPGLSPLKLISAAPSPCDPPGTGKRLVDMAKCPIFSSAMRLLY